MDFKTQFPMKRHRFHRFQNIMQSFPHLFVNQNGHLMNEIALKYSGHQSLVPSNICPVSVSVSVSEDGDQRLSALQWSPKWDFQERVPECDRIYGGIIFIIHHLVRRHFHQDRFGDDLKDCVPPASCRLFPYSATLPCPTSKSTATVGEYRIQNFFQLEH